jgi:hypothetical protein
VHGLAKPPKTENYTFELLEDPFCLLHLAQKNAAGKNKGCQFGHVMLLNLTVLIQS